MEPPPSPKNLPTPASTCQHLSITAQTHAFPEPKLAYPSPNMSAHAKTCRTCAHLSAPPHTCASRDGVDRRNTSHIPHIPTPGGPAGPIHLFPHLSVCATIFQHAPTPAHTSPYVCSPGSHGTPNTPPPTTRHLPAHVNARLHMPAHGNNCPTPTQTCAHTPTHAHPWSPLHPRHTFLHPPHLPPPSNTCAHLPAPPLTCAAPELQKTPAHLPTPFTPASICQHPCAPAHTSPRV
jgi:hypothetical protein